VGFSISETRGREVTGCRYRGSLISLSDSSDRKKGGKLSKKRKSQGTLKKMRRKGRRLVCCPYEMRIRGFFGEEEESYQDKRDLKKRFKIVREEFAETS